MKWLPSGPALRAQGADAEPTRRAVAAGLEESSILTLSDQEAARMALLLSEFTRQTGVDPLDPVQLEAFFQAAQEPEVVVGPVTLITHRPTASGGVPFLEVTFRDVEEVDWIRLLRLFPGRDYKMEPGEKGAEAYARQRKPQTIRVKGPAPLASFLDKGIDAQFLLHPTRAMDALLVLVAFDGSLRTLAMQFPVAMAVVAATIMPWALSNSGLEEEGEVPIWLEAGEEQGRFDRIMDQMRFELLARTVEERARLRVQSSGKPSYQQLFETDPPQILYQGEGKDAGIQLGRIVYQPPNPALPVSEAFLARLYASAWNAKAVLNVPVLAEIFPPVERRHGQRELRVTLMQGRRPLAGAQIRVRREGMLLKILVPEVPPDQRPAALRVLTGLVAKFAKPIPPEPPHSPYLPGDWDGGDSGGGEATDSGLEERNVARALAILEEAAPQGEGILVLEAGVLGRAGLEEFVACVGPELGERFMLFGKGSAAAKEAAARSGIRLVDSDDPVDLAFVLAGLEERANRIGYVGSAKIAGILSRILPPTMNVTPLDPQANLPKLLSFSGYPAAVLEGINASGLEEQMARSRAA